MILLDMDGVLCDWVGGVCRLFGRDQVELEAAWPADYDICVALGITTEQLWAKVDAAGEDFWADLQPYPWTTDLWAACSQWEPTLVCTSPSFHPSSLSGKLRWLHRHLADGAAFRDYVITPRKEAMAGGDRVLIDDRDAGCDAFRAGGGLSFVFPRPWNSNRSLAHDPMAAVMDYLGGTP